MAQRLRRNWCGRAGGSAERAKTKRLDAEGAKVPEYGLMPPGVTADWDRYAYRFFNDVQYCHGLEAIARRVGCHRPSRLPALLAERAVPGRPVAGVPLDAGPLPGGGARNGTWVPNHPAMLDIFGNVEEWFRAEDANRSWCYSVEIGTHHMAANGLLDPHSAKSPE